MHIRRYVRNITTVIHVFFIIIIINTKIVDVFAEFQRVNLVCAPNTCVGL